MITLNSCPNCESSSFTEYQVLSGGGLTVEIISNVHINTQIIVRYCKCQKCNLIFQNPRLSDEELNIYYGSGYYRKTINPPPEGMDKGEEIRAETDFKIINNYLENPESHLDIGCGRGYFLNIVNARTKIGIESDEKYVKYKNVQIYSDLSKIPKMKFKLVSALHVLEHVSRPLEYLEKIIKLLDIDGFFVLEVPSAKTRGGPLGFAHISFFETDVLKLMCKQVGLKIVATEFTPHLLLICQRF